MRQSVWQRAMGIVMLCMVALVSGYAGELGSSQAVSPEAKTGKPVVVLDAGHGGMTRERWALAASLRKI